MRDAEWIATQLRSGLLRGSFILEQDICDSRRYTRYQKAIIRDIASQKNRIEELSQSIGRDMMVFPAAQHICSWAGLAPENHESAEKKKKQGITQGNN